MHDGSALTWREIVEHHHSRLVDELSIRLDSDLQDVVAKAVGAERALLNDQLTTARVEDPNNHE